MSMECKLCEIVSAKLRLVGFFLVHLLGLFTTLFFLFYLNPIFLSVNVVKEKAVFSTLRFHLFRKNL